MSATVTLRVRRSNGGGDGGTSYSSFAVPFVPNMDVLDGLRFVREHLDPSLGFRAACGEGKCGLCGVLVDGKPALACKRRLEPDRITTLEPLPGFPVVRDLFVDRASYYDEERELLSRIEKGEVPEAPVDSMRHDEYIAFKDCTECSLCTAACPSAPALSHSHAGPPGFLQAVRSVLFEPARSTAAGGEELYRCLLCGQCEALCPRGVAVPALNRKARGAAAAAGWEPTALTDFLTRLTEQRAITAVGGHGTAGWLRDAPAEVRARVGVRAPVGVFVGCQFGLRPSRYATAIHLAQLLLLAGVEFTLLGDEEWCCGHPYHLAGDGSRMREFAEHNLAAFRKLGVREIIAACPGCYTAWAGEYPEALGTSTGLKVEHSSVALLRCVEAKRLSPKETTLGRVVYHDPCELGRLHGMYESPRELLRRAGVSVLELEHTRDTAQCCGAGGLAAAAAPAVAKQATSRRVEEMLDLEPTAIVTSCPNCETTLETALRRYRRNVRVLDIVDVLLESVTFIGQGSSKDDCPTGRR